MSRCGRCRSGLCTCRLFGDAATSKVLGTGSPNEPFQVRRLTPEFRYVGTANRTTTMSITLNTDTVIPFEASELPITAGHMWNIAQPTRLTAAITGLYMIGGYAGQGFVGGSVGHTWSVWLAKNGVSGTPIVRRSVTTQLSDTSIYCSLMTLTRLTAGDYIELYVRSNRTASTTGTYISGPLTGIKTDPYIWAQWMDA